MKRFLEALKRLLAGEPGAARGPRHDGSMFVGGTNVKDIENAPEGRAQELAGHAPERVDT
jgi:hypothetical protein